MKYSIICKVCGNPFDCNDPRRVVCGPACLSINKSRHSGEAAGNYIHGAAVNGKTSPEYNSWCGMQERVNAKLGDPHYQYYAAKGVKIAPEWVGPSGFRNFLAHVGLKPSPSHTIDRYPNNDGNYEPGNVRWASREQQSQNRRPRTHCRRGHPNTPESRTLTGACRQCRLITDTGRGGHR